MNSHIKNLFLLPMLLAIGNLAHAATITWTNTSGGKWSVAANWSPNQVPTNTDTVLITTPGSYAVALDVVGVFNTTNVASLTLGAGSGAAGVQTFVMTNSFNVGSLLLVTGGGVLNTSGDNAGFSGAMTVANGGVLNLAAGFYQFAFDASPLIVTNGGMVTGSGQPYYGSLGFGYFPLGHTFNGPVTVANGGVLDVNGAFGNVMVANGGLMTAVGSGGALTVAHGGVLNITNGLSLSGPLNNSGSINLTNGTIGLINNVFNGGTGGLFNQPGGLISLQGSGGIGAIINDGIGHASGYYFGYVTNQGVILQSGGTNGLSTPVFDNSLGTITNLSGTLSLGLFQTNLTGTYFAAPSATIQFVGADIPNDNAAPRLTLGTPLMLAGGGQYQLRAGYLYLPVKVPPSNLALMGDTLQLGPGFQGGAITNLTLAGIQLLNALPVTGTLTATNSSIATNLTVAAGGVLSYEGQGAINGTVTVADGGVFNVINSSGSIYGYPLILDAIVAHGGIMNVEGPTMLIYSLTNAGTLNLTAPINFYKGTNGILNQAGGLINLGTNGDILIATPTDYFINQGTVVENAGAGATNSISYQATTLIYIATNLAEQISIYLPFDFDNSQGTISNLSGTLVLASFQNILAGNYYAAAGTTIQLGGGSTNAPLQAGTPLVLGGSGQYQFISGYLYLAANAIPNLSLQGGLLTLSAAFQGGAITNLTLAGITLSNQFSTMLPVTGNFTVLNSGSSGSLNNAYLGFYGNGVYGNYSVAGGGVLTVSNVTMYGSVAVTGGGVLNASAFSQLHGNLTVAGGGVVNSTGNSIYGSVSVASGGVFDSLDTFVPLYGRFLQSSSMNGPMTNSGTINMTNSGIGFYNDGTTNYQGCLINQAGGLIDFWGNTGVGGSGGYAYLVNQGQIIKSGGSSYSGFDFNLATNSGTVTARTGPMILGNQWISLPASSLNVVLNSATNYGSFIISSNFPSLAGNAGLAGAFNATLTNGYVPTNGTTFIVLSYGSLTGSFNSLGLPAGVMWQSTFGATNLTLTAEGGKPQFGTFMLSGTNLVFNGTGGTAGSNYVMLASTNLALALINWTALTTNIFDGSGQFHYTNYVNPVKPRQFFIFKLP